jgi:Flp pilus assembly protein TadD
MASLRLALCSGLCLTIISAPAVAQQTAADYFESGITKSKANDFTGALQAFSMAITMNPDNAASYYNLRPISKITGVPF